MFFNFVFLVGNDKIMYERTLSPLDLTSFSQNGHSSQNNGTGSCCLELWSAAICIQEMSIFPCYSSDANRVFLKDTTRNPSPSILTQSLPWLNPCIINPCIKPCWPPFASNFINANRLNWPLWVDYPALWSKSQSFLGLGLQVLKIMAFFMEKSNEMEQK